MSARNKAGQQKRPQFRLVGQMILAVMVSLVLVEIAWLSASYVMETARVPARTEAQVRMMLKAAVDPRAFPTLETEVAVVERLAEAAHVVGARIEDTAGEPLASVGEAPDITVLEARREDFSSKVSADRKYLDLYVPAEEIRFAHAMTVRVALEPYYGTVLGVVLQTGVTVVNIVILTSTGLFLALYPILFRPLTRIRSAIMRGVNDLDIADTFMIRWKRKDELNDLAKAVNMLLAGASKNYNDTLHTAHEVISNAPVATVAYRNNGELSFANQAALEMFDAADLEELAAQDHAFLILKGATSQEPVTVESALIDGPFLDEGQVLTPTGLRHMVCIGNVTYRMDGSVRRYLAQFLEMNVAMPRIAQLVTHSEKATQRRIVAEQRAIRLRIMLESCLSMLDTDEEISQGDIGIVRADAIIIAWAKVYASVGRARRVLYNRLPQLSGHRKRVTILFRQALSYADFVSSYTDSEIKVLAVTESNMVRFDFTEMIPEGSTPKDPSDISGNGEITLCRGAMVQLIHQCGGRIDLPANGDGPVKFSFTLPKVMKLAGSDRAKDESGEGDGNGGGQAREAA
ncbi:MAG TPA: hypothetical protein PK405_00525 [Hyphomicrobiales bacterium]|nr:hypothetical protein [Rhodobiaceae bacterium]HXK53146.1 hypothetical protein [Hyphomicrobiales bacterium]